MLVARLLGYCIVMQVDDMQSSRRHVSKGGSIADYVKRFTIMVMGRLAHGIVAVSTAIKSVLVEESRLPSDRIMVLPNGVDTDLFRPLPREEAVRRARLDPNLRYLMFCGRFEPWVDFDLILRAFATVSAHHADVRLLLVGDGNERARIEQLARELGVREKTIAAGFISDRTRVADLMGAATIMLMAHRTIYAQNTSVSMARQAAQSAHEPPVSGRLAHIFQSPIKLAEYMASGRAIVAKDVPGIKEALEESGGGVLVNHDPDSMASAIESLLEEGRADRLGIAGRYAAENSYTWRSVVRRTLTLFSS